MRGSKLVLFIAALTLVSTAHAQHLRGAQEIMTEEVQLLREPGRNLKARGQFLLNGGIELVGQVSAAQVFSRGKLIPCKINRDPSRGIVVATRKSCDDSQRIYVPLTDGTTQAPTSIAPGVYLLGYENSLYPGYVVVRPGQTTRITLTQIPVPAGATVRIFRDLTSLDEQRKIYFSTYLTGKSFFTLGEWAFGELYIHKPGNLNAPVQLDYSLCEETPLQELTVKGDRICRAWNQGSFMGLMELFDFKTDARFAQWEVRKPGKPYEYKFGRLLVAKATTSTRSTFVNVLPGHYSIELAKPTGETVVQPRVTAGPADPATGQLVSAYGLLPTPQSLALATLPLLFDGEPALTAGETCSSAVMWRTDARAYCKKDTQEGCARVTARLCEPMIPDLN